MLSREQKRLILWDATRDWLVENREFEMCSALMVCTVASGVFDLLAIKNEEEVEKWLNSSLDDPCPAIELNVPIERWIDNAIAAASNW